MTDLMWTDADVTAALDLDTAIRSQRTAFEALADGRARLAPKVSVPSGTGTALSYLGTVSPEHGAVAKLVSVHPGNAELDLPVISGTLLVLDARTGGPRAVLAGTALTELRTAAGSAVAVDALAPGAAADLAVLGSGVQARAHVRAIARVRELRSVRVHGRNRQRREALAAELAAELGLDVRPADTAEQAVRGAAIIATCTLSAEPVVATDLLEPGATVVSVGSFEPHRHEVDAELVRRAGAVVVDDADTAAGHAGPIVRALRDGDLDRDRLRSLGEVLTGRAPGRTAPEDLVFYNSVGVGVQDAAAAHAVLGTL
ncbi:MULTISPECIES: ornithine cyclodeaminase family protein [unclassified Saccharopolyspora]|uniref:ornithine cyclodeaminase family protein n=1 Tax=unclassified Saccharopolyspora TaxID=2646250 RepID=UPI001CD329CE|nr:MULTISPECIES: ornithine cyclodeaminase family protein [unclassified Saccharopolyspora]MCA1185647.1 ornithine cyclodeaminase family protein [Saccharopolyspora sp. 6T]MCA1280703.1 ornithine cyclodeaminase family protein [Saccharopolyspora sp. 7B]